jgi:hypothetical protein
MKKNINEELQDIKFLFKYKPGVVLSEQVEDDEVDFDMTEMGEQFEDDEIDFDMMDGEMDEQREVDTPVKPGIKTPTKPSKPGTPYRPKPGPKKAPKAEKRDIPYWLSFNELGIKFE